MRLLRRFGWPLGAILVVLAAIVMVRLGFWQLDRLAQRQALNQRVIQGLEADPLDLGQPVGDAAAIEFRRAAVRGVFDHSQEFLLMGRSLGGQPGYHVVTPLRIEGSDLAVLVDRGWVPLERRAAEQRSDLREPGVVEVQGFVRRSQQPVAGRLGPVEPPLQPGETRREAFFFLTVDRVQQQIPYPLLPLYLEREETPSGMRFPVANPQINLSEGPHLGYAVQWFSFAAISVIGYVAVYVKQRRRRTTEMLALPDGSPAGEA